MTSTIPAVRRSLVLDNPAILVLSLVPEAIVPPEAIAHAAGSPLHTALRHAVTTGLADMVDGRGYRLAAHGRDDKQARAAKAPEGTAYARRLADWYLQQLVAADRTVTPTRLRRRLHPAFDVALPAFGESCRRTALDS